MGRNSVNPSEVLGSVKIVNTVVMVLRVSAMIDSQPPSMVKINPGCISKYQNYLINIRLCCAKK